MIHFVSQRVWQTHLRSAVSRIFAAVCISGIAAFATPAFASAVGESLQSRLDFNAVAPLVSARLHPKWTHMRARHVASRSAYKLCRANADLCPAELRSYTKMVESGQGKCRQEQLRMAQHFVAQFNRDADFSPPPSSNWLSPREFLQSGGSGADEAITKYFLLRDMGFAANDLRVVLAFEPVEQVFDAALTANIDGQVYVLESTNFYGNDRRDDDKDARYYPDFRAYEFAYAINEVSFWDYGSDRLGVPQGISM